MRRTDRPGTRLLTDIGVSLTLLTRLPLPPFPDHAFARQAQAVWAFAPVGLVVAGVAVLAGWLGLACGLSAGAAAGVLLAVQIAVTGAIHEDGLADTADGLWGGVTPARRLQIMKDSHIGTYGVLALILSLGLRWVALSGLLAAGVFAPVVAAAVVSRAGLPMLMTALPPARPGGLSRAVGRPNPGVSAAALALGVILALLFAGPAALGPMFAAGLATLGVAALARARIGGQTGDILGAAQQVGEIAMLLGFQATLAG